VAGGIGQQVIGVSGSNVTDRRLLVKAERPQLIRERRQCRHERCSRRAVSLRRRVPVPPDPLIDVAPYVDGE
jgi:hypothetical protein